MEIGEDNINMKTAGQESGMFGPATKDYYTPNEWSLVRTSANDGHNADSSSVEETRSDNVGASFLAIKPALRKSNE